MMKIKTKTMKIKTLTGIVCLVLFYGCGCSDETINLELNEFESSAMSMTAENNIPFINSNQELLSGRTTDKSIEYRNLSNDDGCTVLLAESHENKLIFETLGKTYTTYIEKRNDNKSNIVISDDTGFYGIENLNTENLEEKLSDFTSDGFEFNNVFVLNSGSHSGFIIYSPSYGIVFIKNDDSSFLKREE